MSFLTPVFRFANEHVLPLAAAAISCAACAVIANAPRITALFENAPALPIGAVALAATGGLVCLSSRCCRRQQRTQLEERTTHSAAAALDARPPELEEKAPPHDTAYPAYGAADAMPVAVALSPEQIEADQNLIRMFARIPGAPHFDGDTFHQAQSMRRWMQINAAILDKTTTLDLSNCSLTKIPPEIGLFRNLRYLILERNQIANLDGAAFPPALQSLHLDHNQIVSLDGAAFPPALQSLHLDHNQIVSLAGAAFPPALQALHLYNNHIVSLAGAAFPPALQELYLGFNHIVSLAGAAFPPALRWLYLVHNQIHTLPDTVFLLSSCHICIDGNLFTAATVAAVQARLDGMRAHDPNHGPRIDMSIDDAAPAAAAAPLALADQLASWQAEFPPGSAPIDISPFLALDAEAQQQLLVYLGKLREIADYRNPANRPSIVGRVYSMLHLASINEEFRNQMQAVITEGSHTCGDRVLIIFNDIEVLGHLYHDDLTDKQAAILAIQAERYFELNKYAQHRAEARGHGEEIETVLCFQIRLKDLLRLPITTEHMLYPGCSGVTQDMLEEGCAMMRRMTPRDLLARSDFWQARMKKLHPREVAAIEERYVEILEQATEFYANTPPENRSAWLAAHPDFLPEIRSDLLRPDFSEASKAILYKRGEAISRLSPITDAQLATA